MLPIVSETGYTDKKDQWQQAKIIKQEKRGNILGRKERSNTSLTDNTTRKYKTESTDGRNTIKISSRD